MDYKIFLPLSRSAKMVFLQNLKIKLKIIIVVTTWGRMDTTIRLNDGLALDLLVIVGPIHLCLCGAMPDAYRWSLRH